MSRDTGLGVPAAELTFARVGAEIVRTDDHGAFTFVPHVPGRWRLAAVSAAGFLPYAPEWGQSPVSVEALPGRRVRGIAIFLSPAIEYLGLVVDPDGRPVAGAEVQMIDAWSSENSLLPLPARHLTDAAGAFRFHAHDGAILEARHPRWTAGRAAVDFSARVARRLVVRLGPPQGTSRPDKARIAGRVLGPDGPVEGAHVVAEAPVAEATTDHEGVFSLNDLEPGMYRVTATHAGLAPSQVDGVAAGTLNLELVMRVGGKLRGKVLDAATGEPIISFLVDVWRWADPLRSQLLVSRAFIEPTGDFEIAGLPAGPLQVAVSAPGYAWSRETRVDVSSEGTPAFEVFRLVGGARLAGTVVERASSVPIAGARVAVEAPIAQTGLHYGVPSSIASVQPVAVTDASGRFVLTNLAPGPLALQVSARDHHGRVIGGLVVPESGDPVPLTIDLEPTQEGEDPRLERVSIGVAAVPEADGLRVVHLYPSSGAQEAGLVEGDFLLAVGGQPLKGLGLERAIELMGGPEGTVVLLTVRRSNGLTVEIPVTRRRIRT